MIHSSDVPACREATDALTDIEQPYRVFFEKAGVGNAEADPLTGRFLRVNPKLCEITGFPEAEIWEQTLRDLPHPEDRDLAWDEWQHFLESGKLEYTGETRYQRKDLAVVWVQLTATLIRNNQGLPLRAMVVFRDITDRRRAVQWLQRARADLQQRVERRTMELATANQALETLIAASPLSIISVDLQHCIRRWNPAAEQLFGWSEAEVLGKPLPNLPEVDRSRYEAELSVHAAEPRITPVETQRLRRDGTLVEVSFWCAPLFNAEAQLTGFMGIFMETTERKRLERALLEASEREQRRIGQDLHDHLCQHLLGVACMLKALALNADQGGATPAADLHSAARLANDGVQQARDIARGLHPVELDAGGLMSALQGLAERTAASLPCELECDHPVLVQDRAAAMHIYRIAQEAVTNALRHAHASRICIALGKRDDRVVLMVSDNGCGLPSKPVLRESMGLDIMKYRANAINGSLKLETPSAGGTRVTCSIPTPQ